MIKLVYFAWLREAIGVAEETLLLDAPASLASIIERLRNVSDGHRRAFSDLARIRAAVNQDFAGFEATVAPGDEVALFPPVTGG